MDFPEIYSFLREHYLFNMLAYDELEQVAKLFQPLTLRDGEILFHADYPGRNFFLVVKGLIKLTGPDGEQISVTSNGHFGEKVFWQGRNRIQTASSTGHTTVLAINKIRFIALTSAYPQIKHKIQAIQLSDQLAKVNEFPWIGKCETIRFIDRKHLITFFTRLIFPLILSLSFSTIILYFNLLPLLLIPLIVLGFSLWVLWTWIDWGNDFYLVTSERVAWVEKVVWLYDQRKELPLKSILSVNLSTTQLQRFLGYGDVVVRTYTGDLTMRNAGHPQVLLDLIQDAQHQARERYQKVESTKINQTIRNRLGFTANTPADTEEKEEISIHSPSPSPQGTESITPLQQFINLFRSRFELNGVITYRKHIFVLLKNSWWCLLILLGLITSFFARLVNMINFPSLVLISLFLIADLIILGYIFVDWANDRFQITDKHIIDLDRKPFGRETKRSALLENVLSLDYERKNITQRLFNFGTVAINVGDIQLDFENVANPQLVQREIFDRYNTAVKKKEIKEADQRREDMVEFLAAYHQESSSPSTNQNDEESDPTKPTNFPEQS